MSPFVRVTLASTKQKSELVVVEIEYVATQFGGEGSSPWPVVGIGDFVDSARVVENGEQGNDFDVRTCFLCQLEAVLKDSCPVRNTVVAAQWQGVVFENGLKDGEKVHAVILPLAYDIHDGIVSLHLLFPVLRCKYLLHLIDQAG